MLCLTEQPAQRISIHAPPRGATVSVREASDMVIFQFPPLREGRPCPVVQHLHHDAISIPAPPRGATWH